MKLTAQEKSYADYRKKLRQLVITPIAKAAAHEEALSKEQEKQMVKDLTRQMGQGLDEYLTLLHEGIMLLQIEGKLPAAFLDGRAQTLLQNPHWAEKKQILQHVLEITNDEVLVIYSLASEYYQRSAYHEAQALFMLMIEINPSVPAAWQGLGMCREKEGNYKEAAPLYIMAAELDDQNLAPYLWAADCLKKLGQDEERTCLLEYVIDRCEEHPHLSAFKQAALLAMKGGKR